MSSILSPLNHVILNSLFPKVYLEKPRGLNITEVTSMKSNH